MIKYLFPTKIIESSKVENASALLGKKDLQIGLNESEVATVKAGARLVLDFSKEIHGGVRLLVFKVKGDEKKADVKITFGESLSEAYSEIGDKNATDDHSPRSLACSIVSLSDLTFGQTGFRFVRIDFPQNAEIELKCVVAKSYELKAKQIYKYEGGDERISNIFSVAKRTVDLCASGDYLWDGIKRDRLVWIGDIHPEMLALTTLYGRVSIIEKSLDFIKNQTPLPNYMNDFPTYSMWWITIVADYYKITKNEKFAKKQLNYLLSLIDLMDEKVDENGEMTYPGYFVDWQSHNTLDEITGSRFINIIAVKKAIELLKIFNLYCEKAENLLKKLYRGSMEVQKSKSVLALKYFALGNLSDREYFRLIENRSVGMSTFTSYYILTAIASKDKALAIEIMKEYYGAMLDKGATTFWEDFNIEWCDNSSTISQLPKAGEKDIHGDFGAHCYKGFRHSLCHGWSAGVIRFIYENC